MNINIFGSASIAISPSFANFAHKETMDHREMHLLLLAIRWDLYTNANIFFSQHDQNYLSDIVTYVSNRTIFVILSAVQFRRPPVGQDACKTFFRFHVIAFRSLMTALELVLSLRSETTCCNSFKILCLIPISHQQYMRCITRAVTWAYC